MKEPKKLQVAPSQEETFINAYAAFGWELVSSQEIKVKDSHQELGKGLNKGYVMSVTETENYVNLIFSRETSIPNYQQLNNCQKKFEAAYARLMSAPKFRALGLIVFPIYLPIYFVKKSKVQKCNDAAKAEMNSAISQATKLRG